MLSSRFICFDFDFVFGWFVYLVCLLCRIGWFVVFVCCLVFWFVFFLLVCLTVCCLWCGLMVL